MSRNNATLSISPKGLHAGMSFEEFAAWGSDDVAFIKPSMLEGEPVCILTNARGAPLGIGSDEETAVAEAIALGFTPYTVH